MYFFSHSTLCLPNLSKCSHNGATVLLLRTLLTGEWKSLERSCPKDLWTHFGRVKVQCLPRSTWKRAYAPFSSQRHRFSWTINTCPASPAAQISYGINQSIWVSVSLPPHPQTVLPWFLLSLLLNFSQLSKEQFSEERFLSPCHHVCFLVHLLSLIPIEGQC